MSIILGTRRFGPLCGPSSTKLLQRASLKARKNEIISMHNITSLRYLKVQGVWLYLLCVKTNILEFLIGEELLGRMDFFNYWFSPCPCLKNSAGYIGSVDKLCRIRNLFINKRTAHVIIIYLTTNKFEFWAPIRKLLKIKSRIRETKNHSTDADSRTDTILERLCNLSAKEDKNNDYNWRRKN